MRAPVGIGISKTLVEKLSEVMAVVGYVKKDAVNEFHQYRYASAEAVLKKVNAALSERGIAVSSHAELVQQNILESDKGLRVLAVVKLSMDFTDGQEIIHAEGLGSGLDSGDKAVMKANTAALKYLVANVFLISWGDDPEADPATDAGVYKTEADPLTGEDIPDYPRMNTVIASMKGKRGVRELRQIVAHAQMAGWNEDQLFIWAEENGVKFGNSEKYSEIVRLRDLIKEQRTGVKE